jgi:uncharacterized protein involved in exopolysaccharide biosynthesis
MTEDKGLTVRDILNIIYKKILILKLVVILIPLGVLFACLVVTPVYQVAAKVIITAKKDEGGLLAASGPGAQRIINMNVDEIDQNSEMEILKSPDVWIKTVKALGPDFFKGKASGTIGRFFRELGVLSESLEESKQEDNSESSKERTIAKSLMAGFEVTPVTKSKVLDLTLKDSDPNKVQKILSKLLTVYLQYHSQVYSVPGAQEFFSVQLAAAKEKYDLARKVLIEHKKKWNLAAPDRQENELVLTLKMLEDAMIQTGGNMRQYEEMLTLLKNRQIITGQLAASPQRGNESTVTNVIGVQLIQAEQKLKQVGQIYTTNSRDYRESDALVNDLYSQFKSAVSTEVSVASIKTAALEQAKKRVTDQMHTLVQTGEQLRALQLDLSVAREQYLQFLAKEQAARLEGSEGRQKLVDVKVLGQPWTPKTPIFPKTGLYVLLAFIFSFPLGIGIIFMATYLDHSFDDPASLEAATGYKVLASFGTVKGEKPPGEVK